MQPWLARRIASESESCPCVQHKYTAQCAAPDMNYRGVDLESISELAPVGRREGRESKGVLCAA